VTLSWGEVPDCVATVGDVKWYGYAANEFTNEDPAGTASERVGGANNSSADLLSAEALA
jgi:hypothetical protein